MDLTYRAIIKFNIEKKRNILKINYCIQIIYIYHQFTIIARITLWAIAAIWILIVYTGGSILAWTASTIIDYVLASCVCVTNGANAKKIAGSCIDTSAAISAHRGIAFIYWNRTVYSLVAGSTYAVISAYRWYALTWIFTWILSTVINFYLTVWSSKTHRTNTYKLKRSFWQHFHLNIRNLCFIYQL